METFGERLTTEREEHGLTIPAVAETLRVDPQVLLALERNDFGALPGEAEMMECLHAYADCLEVDADLMIADYLQEREKGLGPAAETRPGAAPTGARPRGRLATRSAVLVVVAIALFAAWWLFARNGTPPPPEIAPIAAALAEPDPRPATIPIETAPAPDPPAPSPAAAPPEIAPALDPPAAPARADTSSSPPALTISDHGVGTAVEDRSLVGRGDAFPIGSQVWFWTYVRGGGAGDKIDHVWLREGVETTRVSLSVGGPSWRTYSNTTLPGGAASWAVEARDAAGRLLARSEFVSR